MASAPDIDRIKRNIGRMIEQNAPETDIDSYIKTEGVTAEQLRTSKSAPAPAPADERPWYSKLGSAADDMVRIGANAMTFGYADKLAGTLGGEGTDAERAKTNAARDRAGSAAYAADIGGGLATGMGLANSGVTAMRLVPQGMKGFAGLGARTGAMAADGAAYGALSATGNDTDVTEGALLGGAAGALGNVGGEAISRGIGKVAGAFNAKPNIPSPEALRASKDAAYKAADDAGVILGPGVVQGARDKIVQDLAEFGYLPANQPKVGAVLSELDRIAESNVTLKGLDQARKIASNSFDPTNKASNAIMSKIVARLDEAASGVRPEDVVTGNAPEAVSQLLKARDLNTRVSKMDRVTEALTKAERRAASTGSGGNVENATRQNIRAILDSPSKRRGFTADEIAAMEELVRGTPTQNALRLVGKLSPQGNGLMAALGIGATAANPLLAAAPVAGMAAKSIADKGTRESVETLQDIIRAGGKRSAVSAPPNAVQRLAEAKREALIRAILGGSLPTLTGAE